MSNKTALPPLPTLLNEDGVGNLSTPASLLPPGRAQCYIAIFEDALEQLSVLGDITPEAMKTDNKQLAEKITKILGEQRMLQDKYQELLLERDQSKGMANKTKFKEIQSTLADISNQLSLLTQTLGRLLKTHPSVAQNLLKIQQERSALQALLARSIRELRECKFDSLIHAVEEEYKKRNTLQNTISRESDAQETLKELQRELANEKKLIQDETNDRNQVIQQLKDTIQEINALTVSEQKYIKKEVKAHENSVKLSCSHREAQLQQEKIALLDKIEQERLAHEKIMDFLQTQRGDLEKSIQEWMVHYEEDTEAKSMELEQLKARRTQDLDKFEELVLTFESLEKIVEDDRRLRAQEAEEKRINFKRNEAATTIQRWYRKYKAIRTELLASKAPAKKGKGKKGKKGKK
ncbi:hypothetical protein HDV03_002991 [Kappamyces sp. JEL0829]|nr:hypothetical protein HDV03_002991 [Kappamyces sp. JEL0829]